jgi:nicotinamidase-related amidase
MKGSFGAKKIQETPQDYVLVNPGEYHKVRTTIDSKTPLYFSKTTYDVFENPEFEKFIKEYGVKEAYVMGVATDYCVKAAVLGMIKLGVDCFVITNAIKGVSEDTTKAAMKEMKEAGAFFI